MAKMPLVEEIRVGMTIPFGSGPATVAAYYLMGNRARLLLIREDLHAPYLVTWVNSNCLRYREWEQGFYFDTLARAVEKYDLV